MAIVNFFRRSVIVCALVLTGAVAFGQAPVQAWVQRYNGPGNYYDVPYAMVLTTNGNVIVTGSSYNISLVGGVIDYTTMAYSSAGVPLWTNRYGSPADYGTARAIAVSPAGNVIVTGESQASIAYPYDLDLATVAYSSAGVALWTNRYGGSSGADDGGLAITTDSNNRVVVTGYSYVAGSSQDYVTVAYSNFGSPLWTNRYNGPGNGMDSAVAIATDSNDNVLVTGYSAGIGSGADFATIKYSSAGVALWTNRFGGPTNSADRATAIAVDASGNVFVTGYSGVEKDDTDYVTIKYSSAGIPLWTNRYNGPGGHSIDTATAIAVDANGKVFVTGGAWNGINTDFVTVAYANNGVPLWTNRFDGTNNSTDTARAIVIDTIGTVLVTGSSYPTNGSTDFVTVAYANSGGALWTNRYNGPGNGVDTPRAIAAAKDGSVFVAGDSAGVTGYYDYAVVKYSPVQPSLGIQRGVDQVVLTWNNIRYSLQAAPGAKGTFTNIVGATSPYTNAITAGRKFFRLISN